MGHFGWGLYRDFFFLEMKGFSRRTSFFFRGKQWESRLVIFEYLGGKTRGNEIFSGAFFFFGLRGYREGGRVKLDDDFLLACW